MNSYGNFSGSVLTSLFSKFCVCYLFPLGEELRICYIDASMDHQARQNVLMGGFGFKCSCHRCVEGD